MLSVERRIYDNSVRHQEKAAIIDAVSGAVVTYAELWRQIESAATWYRRQGLVAGDRVLLSASKDTLFIPAYFGLHMAGMTAVPIDPETNTDRLKLIMELSAPKLCIGTLRNASGIEIRSFNDIDFTDMDTSFGFPEGESISDILFTTGTTGLAKGVALTADNEAAAADNINTFIGNGPEDVELIALPISHSFGLGRLRCVLASGGTVVLLAGFASMKKFYKSLEDYKVTGFGMVPASWAYISKMSGDRLGQYASTLRYIEMGSAPLPLEEKQHLMRLLPDTRICMHYGLTEASRSAFIEFHSDKAHIDTAGKAAPNVEIAIFSPDGEKQESDTDGEVCVKGAHVCDSYWGQTEEYFRKDFFGEWFRTGDWGSMSKDGWLSLKGRNKEMINVGGKKVNPLEVEQKLLQIEGITDCACVASPDPVFGEVVKACIVASEAISDASIKEGLSKELENYKQPAIIERVREIPRTSSGKIQRLKLKERVLNNGDN